MNRKSQSERLLGEVYRHAASGRIAAEKVLPAVQNKRLSQELKRQKVGYAHLADTAEVYLGMTGQTPPMVSPIGPGRLGTIIRANLAARSHDDCRVTDSIRKGNIAGADTMRSRLERCPDCDSHAAEIANNLIRFEEENAAKLRQF